MGASLSRSLLLSKACAQPQRCLQPRKLLQQGRKVGGARVAVEGARDPPLQVGERFQRRAQPRQRRVPAAWRARGGGGGGSACGRTVV